MNESSCFFLSVILQAEKQTHLLHNKQMKGTVCGEQAEWIQKAILLTVSLECSLKYIQCFCIKNNKSLIKLTTIKWFLTGFKWSMVDSLPASGRAVNRCFHHGICLSANALMFSVYMQQKLKNYAHGISERCFLRLSLAFLHIIFNSLNFSHLIFYPTNYDDDTNP